VDEESAVAKVEKVANESNSGETAGSSTRREAELQEGLDYYLENGLFVFTAAFLSKRGYCCESGCRHCPYGYTAERAGE
jgi:hypothetical protein